MCDHCVDGRIPVRLTDENGDGGRIVGEVIGASIVDNVGTVYMCVSGQWVQATVPDWYGPDGFTTEEHHDRES